MPRILGFFLLAGCLTAPTTTVWGQGSISLHGQFIYRDYVVHAERFVGPSGESMRVVGRQDGADKLFSLENLDTRTVRVLGRNIRYQIELPYFIIRSDLEANRGRVLGKLDILDLRNDQIVAEAESAYHVRLFSPHGALVYTQIPDLDDRWRLVRVATFHRFSGDDPVTIADNVTYRLDDQGTLFFAPVDLYRYETPEEFRVITYSPEQSRIGETAWANYVQAGDGLDPFANRGWRPPVEWFTLRSCQHRDWGPAYRNLFIHSLDGDAESNPPSQPLEGFIPYELRTNNDPGERDESAIEWETMMLERYESLNFDPVSVVAREDYLAGSVITEVTHDCQSVARLVLMTSSIDSPSRGLVSVYPGLDDSQTPLFSRSYNLERSEEDPYYGWAIEQAEVIDVTRLPFAPYATSDQPHALIRTVQDEGRGYDLINLVTGEHYAFPEQTSSITVRSRGDGGVTSLLGDGYGLYEASGSDTLVAYDHISGELTELCRNCESFDIGLPMPWDENLRDAGMSEHRFFRLFGYNRMLTKQNGALRIQDFATGESRILSSCFAGGLYHRVPNPFGQAIRVLTFAEASRTGRCEAGSRVYIPSLDVTYSFPANHHALTRIANGQWLLQDQTGGLAVLFLMSNRLLPLEARESGDHSQFLSEGYLLEVSGPPETHQVLFVGDNADGLSLKRYRPFDESIDEVVSLPSDLRSIQPAGGNHMAYVHGPGGRWLEVVDLGTRATQRLTQGLFFATDENGAETEPTLRVLDGSFLYFIDGGDHAAPRVYRYEPGIVYDPTGFSDFPPLPID